MLFALDWSRRELAAHWSREFFGLGWVLRARANDLDLTSELAIPARGQSGGSIYSTHDPLVVDYVWDRGVIEMNSVGRRSFCSTSIPSQGKAAHTTSLIKLSGCREDSKSAHCKVQAPTNYDQCALLALPIIVFRRDVNIPMGIDCMMNRCP